MKMQLIEVSLRKVDGKNWIQISFFLLHLSLMLFGQVKFQWEKAKLKDEIKLSITFLNRAQFTLQIQETINHLVEK